LALTPGTRLAAYEITAQIGKGRMGEVYRARDLKLGRNVAIKVLPEDVAREQDRLQPSHSKRRRSSLVSLTG
jgi:serine/threonine protein kinase